MSDKLQLLLIDDEEKIYRSVYLFLEKPPQADPFAFLDEMVPSAEESTRPFECQIHWADSGRKGFERVQQGGRYDLALIDMNMPPGWDGIETIRQIRSLDAQLPIALVTANITTSDEVRALLEQYRVTLFHKPYGKDELNALIGRLLGR
jgi:CheY-like chemotaxis protein